MALIRCPECKKKISDTCDSCPHCGYRFINPHDGYLNNAVNVNVSSTTAHIKQERKYRNAVVALYVLIVFGILFLATSIVMLIVFPITETSMIGLGLFLLTFIAGSISLGVGIPFLIINKKMLDKYYNK